MRVNAAPCALAIGIFSLLILFHYSFLLFQISIQSDKRPEKHLWNNEKLIKYSDKALI